MTGEEKLRYFYLGVFSDEVSVNEGDSVSLNTGVIKQPDNLMLWYFNDTRIALINRDPSTSCLYDGEHRRFRDRVEVDYETGSLTITNIRSEHAGRYEAVINRSKSSGTSKSLNSDSKCNSTKIIKRKNSTQAETIKTFNVFVTVPGSGLSAGAVAGIVVGLLVFAAAVASAGVIYYRHRSSRQGKYHLQTLYKHLFLA
ncbi:hypothetical protein F2P79_013815 [Pimephales promelas]|nr:hypothetical protein F2P79_013815 [Pimephales promelas]